MEDLATPLVFSLAQIFGTDLRSVRKVKSPGLERLGATMGVTMVFENILPVK